MSWYDVNKMFISGVVWGQDLQNDVYVSPANARYVRCSGVIRGAETVETLKDIYMVSEGSSAKPYAPYMRHDWWDCDLKILTGDATAAALDISPGKDAYVNGVKVAGASTRKQWKTGSGSLTVPYVYNTNPYGSYTLTVTGLGFIPKKVVVGSTSTSVDNMSYANGNTFYTSDSKFFYNGYSNSPSVQGCFGFANIEYGYKSYSYPSGGDKVFKTQPSTFNTDGFTVTLPVAQYNTANATLQYEWEAIG